MAKIILVVDIETTGFLEQGGKIVEIGIVKLNLDTGEIIPAYASLIKEPGLDITHTRDPFGWIFRNSDLRFEDLNNAPSLDEVRKIAQHLFDVYEATAYNKDFDFGFLRDRGFHISELPCPMKLATPIINLSSGFLNGSPKWPKLEEAWNYFFGETTYVEAHRALDDAIHEARIVFELFKLGKYSVSTVFLNGYYDHYFRSSGNETIFVYKLSGRQTDLAIYKEIQGTNYRENEKGTPLFFAPRPLSLNRRDIVHVIITTSGQIVADESERMIANKRKLDDYLLREKAKLAGVVKIENKSMSKNDEIEMYDKSFEADKFEEILTPEILNDLYDTNDKESAKLLEQKQSLEDHQGNNQSNDHSQGWINYLVGIIIFSILLGLFKGCLNVVMGNKFVEGFKEQTSWILTLIIVVVFLIIMILIGALFSGRSNRQF